MNTQQLEENKQYILDNYFTNRPMPTGSASPKEVKDVAQAYFDDKNYIKSYYECIYALRVMKKEQELPPLQQVKRKEYAKDIVELVDLKMEALNAHGECSDTRYDNPRNPRDRKTDGYICEENEPFLTPLKDALTEADAAVEVMARTQRVKRAHVRAPDASTSWWSPSSPDKKAKKSKRKTRRKKKRKSRRKRKTKRKSKRKSRRKTRRSRR